MNALVRFDRALDELLVQLGGIVLRLSDPRVTRTAEERRALTRSVNQYSLCATRSQDPRVLELKTELEGTLKPRLQLIVSRERGERSAPHR